MRSLLVWAELAISTDDAVTCSVLAEISWLMAETFLVFRCVEWVDHPVG
jgi:hypothetical protein